MSLGMDSAVIKAKAQLWKLLASLSDIDKALSSTKQSWQWIIINDNFHIKDSLRSVSGKPDIWHCAHFVVWRK